MKIFEKIKIIILAGLLFCGTFENPAEGTTVIKMGLKDLTESAELVFMGRVFNIQSGSSPEDNNIYTYVTFKDLKIIKGEYPSKSITIRLEGGSDGEYYLDVHGMPKFKEKGESIIFLRNNGEAMCPVSGWWQGRWKVIGDNVYKTDGMGRILRKQGLGEKEETVTEFEKKIKRIISASDYEEKMPSSGKKLSVIPPEKIIKKQPYAIGIACGGIASTFTSGSLNVYTYYLGNWGTYAELAMSTWNDVSTSSWEFSVNRTSSQYSPSIHSDGFTSLGWSSLDASTLGVTTNLYYPTTCEKVEADILFNSDKTWSSSGSLGAVDFQSVALHELGHVAGLGHSSTGTVMQIALAEGVANQTLSQDDINGISFLYPGTGDSTTGNTGGNGSTSPGVNTGGGDTGDGGTDDGGTSGSSGETDTLKGKWAGEYKIKPKPKTNSIYTRANVIWKIRQNGNRITGTSIFKVRPSKGKLKIYRGTIKGRKTGNKIKGRYRSARGCDTFTFTGRVLGAQGNRYIKWTGKGENKCKKSFSYTIVRGRVNE